LSRHRFSDWLSTLGLRRYCFVCDPFWFSNLTHCRLVGFDRYFIYLSSEQTIIIHHYAERKFNELFWNRNNIILCSLLMTYRWFVFSHQVNSSKNNVFNYKKFRANMEKNINITQLKRIRKFFNYYLGHTV